MLGKLHWNRLETMDMPGPWHLHQKRWQVWNGTIPGDRLYPLLRQSRRVRLKAVESQMILLQTPDARNASTGLVFVLLDFSLALIQSYLQPSVSSLLKWKSLFFILK